MMPPFNIIAVSPSSPFDKIAVEKGLSLLSSRGINILQQSDACIGQLRYLNGDDDQRLIELERALSNRECQYVWHTRGGYGLTRILPNLKLPIGDLPKVIGFSDASALLMHLWRHRRAKGIHAPMLTSLSKEDPESLDSLWKVLEGNAKHIAWPRLKKLWWPQPSHTVDGHLVVGNLCVLSHLVGTSSMPDLTGTILVLEEVGEQPYRIDRMFTQLHNSGSLKDVKAIVLGQFTSCLDNDTSLSSEIVLTERCQAFSIPLCAGLPVGHGTPNWAIPFGVLARLDVSNDINLTILEEV